MGSRTGLLIGNLLISVGCVDPQYVQDMDKRIQILEKENKELRADMEAAWANALCSDDVRTLMESVNQKCQQSLLDDQDSVSGGFCTDNDVVMAVLQADPRHRGRFLSLMRSQRHAVLYLATGTTAISPARSSGINRLIGKRILPTTRFLIASQSGANPKLQLQHDSKGKLTRAPTLTPAAVQAEGRRRTNLVADHLVQLGVPRDRILKWLFSFPLDQTEIDRLDDLPRLGEPEDLYTSVWVFRVDCQLSHNPSSTYRGSPISK